MYVQAYTNYLMFKERMIHRVLIFIILSSLLITTAPLYQKYSEERFLASLQLLLPLFETVFDWGREDCKSEKKGLTMSGIQIESKKGEQYYYRVRETIVVPQTLLKTLVFKACF